MREPECTLAIDMPTDASSTVSRDVNLSSNGSIPPPNSSSTSEEDKNNTHAFFGGFKARPISDWTIYFDAEHGTADNVFARIGNYNYTTFA
jgi:hypothetical protein